MRSTVKRGLRIAAAWAALAAILACGGNEDDTPPPPTTTAPVAPPVQPPPFQPVAPTPPPLAPQPAAQPTLIQISTGFLPDPQTARGQAGGSMPAAMLTGNDARCRGHFPPTPQHTMILQTDFRNLRVMSHSAQDTTMAIRAPDGSYRCADDDEGLNPIVSGAFAAGTYQIYVGTYHATSTATYVLGVSELMTVTPATLGY